MSQQYDFIAIGDITIDAFIKLSDKDARVTTNEKTGRKKLEMDFGGKLPYDEVTIVNAVGNSPNAAVSAHRLGLRSALVANLGNDRNGKDCLDTLRSNGIDTDFVKIHEGKNTNYHYVLRYGAERTILIKHEEYPYSLPDFRLPPRFLYFSSIGENGVAFHHEIAKFLSEHPETKLSFQPGTFQIRLGYEELKDLYAVTEIFFCNKEEAQEILNTEEQDIPKLLRSIRLLGPKIPVITDGPNGAFALDGDTVWFMPMYPDPKEPISRTGAGDAFSSTFTSAIILGHDVKTALAWGPINSMSVVQQIGAQAGLLTREKIEEYLKDAPENYVPKAV
ncbi:MAG: carbohydrate kinase family protein [Candidatus Pacebacteria bacterium]|nr:carbohydrate kinase family protein [Candidatus Paceibacterota bacterium]MCF7856981.1 carbohydrate kinase family protein [Candidatus Paceibacterota bacterium]